MILPASAGQWFSRFHSAAIECRIMRATTSGTSRCGMWPHAGMSSSREPGDNNSAAGGGIIWSFVPQMATHLTSGIFRVAVAICSAMSAKFESTDATPSRRLYLRTSSTIAAEMLSLSATSRDSTSFSSRARRASTKSCKKSRSSDTPDSSGAIRVSERTDALALAARPWASAPPNE
jgi:hypothetical protein